MLLTCAKDLPRPGNGQPVGRLREEGSQQGFRKPDLIPFFNTAIHQRHQRLNGTGFFTRSNSAQDQLARSGLVLPNDTVREMPQRQARIARMDLGSSGVIDRRHIAQSGHGRLTEIGAIKSLVHGTAERLR